MDAPWNSVHVTTEGRLENLDAAVDVYVYFVLGSVHVTTDGLFLKPFVCTLFGSDVVGTCV